jgi:hypothetical protein
MIKNPIMPWLLSIVGLFAAPAVLPGQMDLLRFTNGDQLHGKFMGINEGLRAVWTRDDLSAPGEFNTSQIRQIVLQNAHPLKPLACISNVRLVNGDRIPGTITGIDEDTITLDTSYAGVLRIPRKQVAMLAPSPLGGRVVYHGPFVENEWKMIHPSFPDGLPEPAPVDAEKTEEQPGRWLFSGSAWYWQNKLPGTALVRESVMPDRSVLRFDLAWKNQLSLVIAFHADFRKVKPKEEENHGEEEKIDDLKKAKAPLRRFMPGDASGLPLVFGNSNIIQIYSNYMMLIRTCVDENGQPSVERIQMNNEHIRLGDRNRAKLEIRSTRSTGEISLFIDDEFIAQWEGNLAGNGNDAKPNTAATGFGFLSQGSESSVRISDVIVSEWNGMPDSARSLQVDEQDIVLMTNGTDRFAGRVDGLAAGGKISFTGKLGEFRFPLEDVAEIRFARKHLGTAPDTPSDQVTVRFSPVGSVSGRPVSGDASNIGIASPILGNLKVSMESAVLLEFNSSNTTVDDWDSDF